MKYITPTQKLFRDNSAKAIREIRGCLLKHEPPLVAEGCEFNAYAVIGSIILASILAVSCLK